MSEVGKPATPNAGEAPEFVPASVPYERHEREMCAVMEERDHAIEWADKLAAAVGSMGAEIGEHSTMNDPWANALAFLTAPSPVNTQEGAPAWAYERGPAPPDWYIRKIREAIEFGRSAAETEPDSIPAQPSDRFAKANALPEYWVGDGAIDLSTCAEIAALAAEYAAKVEAGTATGIDISTLAAHTLVLADDLYEAAAGQQAQEGRRRKVTADSATARPAQLLDPPRVQTDAAMTPPECPHLTGAAVCTICADLAAAEALNAILRRQNEDLRSVVAELERKEA